VVALPFPADRRGHRLGDVPVLAVKRTSKAGKPSLTLPNKISLVGEICGSLIRSNGGRELGSRSPRTRCAIALLQRFAFVASCPSNQFALSGKCYAILQESSAPRADEHAIWDTLRSRKRGSLRAMPSRFETSCAI
jgi:hypothetical protein